MKPRSSSFCAGADEAEPEGEGFLRVSCCVVIDDTQKEVELDAEGVMWGNKKLSQYPGRGIVAFTKLSLIYRREQRQIVHQKVRHAAFRPSLIGS